MAEQAQGYIVKVRNDKRGIKLDNETWYANGFKPELDLKEGEFVKVSFIKNNDFNNYTKIEKAIAPQQTLNEAKKNPVKSKKIHKPTKFVDVLSADNEFELAKRINEDTRNTFATQPIQKIDGSWVAFIYYNE